MGFSFWRVPTAVALVSLLRGHGSGAGRRLPGPDRGQLRSQGGGMGALQPFVSITPVYQGNTDLDRGGDFSVGGVVLRGGAVL